jgi:5-formyltetrahydrofolate cyclo-ligase
MKTLDKKQLRQQLLHQRKALKDEDWQEKSDRLCNQLKSSPIFQEAQTILAYFAVNKEPDLNGLFSFQKQWGFPRCVDKKLQWHSWQPQDELEIGKYNIKNPLAHSPQIEAKQVDLILVPAIACDYQGYRLGYGGGYYDRLFSETQWYDIPKIGVIFDFAYLPHLPRDPWDQKLQGICTENLLTINLF